MCCVTVQWWHSQWCPSQKNVWWGGTCVLPILQRKSLTFLGEWGRVVGPVLGEVHSKKTAALLGKFSTGLQTEVLSPRYLSWSILCGTFCPVCKLEQVVGGFNVDLMGSCWKHFIVMGVSAVGWARYGWKREASSERVWWFILRVLVNVVIPDSFGFILPPSSEVPRGVDVICLV